jgi:hypothetical protein
MHAPNAAASARVGAAMVRAFARAGVGSRAIRGRIDRRGATARTLHEFRNR